MNKSIFIIAFILLVGQMFVVSGQTAWTKDANNPVLRRDTVLANLPNDLIAISDGWLIKEGDTYKMWYTCGGINYPADELLRSRICYAESVDGVMWEKYENNPVMDVDYTGAWDSLGVETASVIIDEEAPASERYKMWYAGQYFNEYRYDIGYAVSPDGIHWTKHGSPVLMVGDDASWDNGFLEGPTVIKDGATYKMWYCGYDVVVNGQSTDGKANIGYATSSDGINWTKYAGNPILTTSTGWESIYVQDPHVIKENDVYLMWYGGGADDSYFDQQVGFATSSDGINWSKSALNPVLERGDIGAWDDHLASFPTVIQDDGIYKMWYTGRDAEPVPDQLDYYWEIGYATAPIGVFIENNVVDDVEFFISPNPASSNTALSFELKNPGHVAIQLYNIIGESMGAPVNYYLESGKQNIDFDIALVPSGIYLIAISSKGITQYAQLMVK
jgi:predicted GH43/DUF377 family glycosyl hydrolase